MSKKKINLDDLINKSRKVYEKFDKSRGKVRLDFGSIYLTRPDNGNSNIVVLIDLFDDDNRFYNKYVTVLPISIDTEFAADDDLIIEDIENGGPLPCDIVIHAGIPMTISVDDVANYYAHLSINHEEMLKDFIQLLQGDYSINIEKFAIGEPIISPTDYRIQYREYLVKELEYLVIPSFLSVSEMLRKNEKEAEIKKSFKQKYKIVKFNYLISYLNDNCNIDLNYKQFIKTYNLCYYSKEKESEIKIINEYFKKGFNIIIQKDHPKGPDLIIENEQGESRNIEIKNDMVFDFYKDKYDKCLTSIKYRIEHGKMEEIPNIIYNWEKDPIPLTKLKNIYGSTLKWIPNYAIGNVKGLKKNIENLLELKVNSENHFDVDNSINIINGRTNYLQGKYEKALEFYYGLDIKDFMVRYMLFTDPRIDCHLLIGDKNGAYELASQNPKLINKRAERALKSSDPTLLYASEAIQAGQILSARA